MKMVIYKQLGEFYVTNEENYKARIQNANKIHHMQDFKSAEEIIEYFCKYFNSKPEDFIIDINKKYTITVAQITYGNIEVEASAREEAKEKALRIAEYNSNCVDWFESKSYKVAEVYRHSEEV